MEDQGEENIEMPEGAEGGRSPTEENIEMPEGAEGGRSSTEESEYELVAEEEIIDTAWESSEVHPKREYPRVGFGRTEQHVEESPPRVYLTNRPTRESPSKQPRVELTVQQLVEQEEREQATAVTEEKSPMKRRISERLQRIKFLSSSGGSPTKQK